MKQYQNKPRDPMYETLWNVYQEDLEKKEKSRIEKQLDQDIDQFLNVKKEKQSVKKKKMRVFLTVIAIILALLIMISRIVFHSTNDHVSSIPEVTSEETDITEDLQNEFDGYTLDDAKFMSHDVIYSLNDPVSKLLENGWKLQTSGFNGAIDVVGEDGAVVYVTDAWGKLMELFVLPGEDSTIEKARIRGVYIADNTADFVLSGNLKIYSGKYTIEEILKASGHEWTKTENKGIIIYKGYFDTYDLTITYEDYHVGSFMILMHAE